MRYLAALLAFSVGITAMAEPIPELERTIRGALSTWSSALSGSISQHEPAPSASEKWDLEQFYLQVNPYVNIGAEVVQLQIAPQFGFLFVREAPEGCAPYHPKERT